MTQRRLHDDVDGPYFELEQRVRALETGRPQEAASIQAGMTKIVSPTGTVFAGLGHADGKSGVLFPSGTSWVTAQELVDARLSALSNGLQEIIGVVNGRVDNVDSRLVGLNTFVGTVNSRVDNVDVRLVGLNSFVGVLNSRVDTVDVKATGAQSSASSAHGRIDNVDGRTTSNTSRVNSAWSAINSLIDIYSALAARVSALDGKSSNPPPVKG